VVDHHPDVPDEDPFATPNQHRASLVNRRRAKVLSEMDRNRRGNHRVPTWVLLAAVLLIIVGYVAIVLFAA